MKIDLKKLETAKQISLFCCEFFIPNFYIFLKYGFFSLIVRK